MTIIKLAHPIKDLEKTIGNYKEIKHIIGGVEFRIPSGSELNIYDINNRLVLACSISEYYDITYITSAFNSNGDKVFEYEIDYNMYDEIEEIKIGDPDTIYSQLGGNKFKVMTGSKISTGYNDKGYVFLNIVLQKNQSKCKYLKISLNGLDLYDMEFSKISKGELIVVESFNNIYGDMLQDIFTEVTGFYTSL